MNAMGMNAMGRLILLCACLMASSIAAADVLPGAPHLVVRGHAEREVRPDRFEVDITISRLGKSVAEIRSTVEGVTRQLVEQLQAAGLAETDIKATNLRIGAEFEYDDETERRTFVGNEASREITARFAGLQDLYRFLADVPAGDEVRVGGVRSMLSRDAEIKLELLDEAVADSKRAADELASRYGQRITGVYSISDQPVAARAYALDRVQVTGSRIGAVLSEGVVKVEKDVYVVFLMSGN